MNQELIEMPALSEATRQVLREGGDSAYAKLVVEGGGGNEDVRAKLRALTPENVLSAGPRSRETAQAMLAGLWLWHDFLDESHAISQALHDETGSFWHAIMHRREGDFSNSKYWYAKCRNHPVRSQLDWDANDFVDRVARAVRKGNDAELVEFQRMEWTQLFTYCVSEATGK
jgi:hypothetical protein